MIDTPDALAYETLFINALHNSLHVPALTYKQCLLVSPVLACAFQYKIGNCLSIAYMVEKTFISRLGSYKVDLGKFSHKQQGIL